MIKYKMEYYKDLITPYYLFSRMYIVNFYNYCVSAITDTNEILILDDNTKPKNILYRYYFIRLLLYLSTFVGNIKKYIDSFAKYYDLQSNKIQVTKKYNSVTKTVILENTKYGADKLSLSDVIYFFNSDVNSASTNMMENVIINFDLVHPDKSTLCLKEFTYKYKDDSGEHNNTIKNILEFNNINVFDDSQVKLKIIKDGKILRYNFPIKNVLDKHINYFFNDVTNA